MGTRVLHSWVLVAGAVSAALLSVTGPVMAQQRALGLDISAWQGSLSATTWNNIHNVESRDFVFIRSSRGGTTGFYNQSDPNNDNGLNTLSQRYDDPYFVQNITRATNAGMFAGPYHYSRPDIIASTQNSGGIANTGADEADHFIQMAGAWMRPGYLLPVHDFEAGDGIRSDNEMAQFAIDFSNRIYDVMGVRPAIYVNGNYANYVLGGASPSLRSQVVAAYPTLWSARWPNQSDPDSIPVQTGHPGDSISWVYGPWDDFGVTHPWAFWQYTSRGRLQSFNNGNSNLDFDVAQGGIEFIKDYLVPALWMDDSSGQWTELSNWNSGQTPVAPVQGRRQVPRVGLLTLPATRLPGVNDTVILDRPNASIAVTLASGTHNIRKLYVGETLSITGGSLTINYVPSWDSTAVAAQFSAPVTLSGSASLSVHTLQVDATRSFTLGGGTLTFDTISLMPHSATPAQIAVTGNVNFNPLADATATIVNGAGSGSSGLIDLGGGDRFFNVANGSADVDLSIDVPIANGALTKNGAGTLALNGANLYTGDTTVQAGELSISSPFLSDMADVFLSTNTTLELNFAGPPDIIDSLFFDGVSQTMGTWGAVGSGAQFSSPLIAGTGMLQVTTFIAPLLGDYNGNGVVGPEDYATWRETFGQSVSPGTGADGNGDGTISAADYTVWRDHLGAFVTAGAGSFAAAAVPEPAGWVLVVAGLLTWPAVRRRIT